MKSQPSLVYPYFGAFLQYWIRNVMYVNKEIVSF
jgi:hypothetical protein